MNTRLREDDPDCPDCGAGIGQPHDDGCDVARCLVTGMQRLQCDGWHKEAALREAVPGIFEDPVCGQDAWTGQWPGAAECDEYGWYTWFRPPPPGGRYGEWVPCGPDHPDAVWNLTRLVTECAWDRQQRRWVRS